MRRTGIALTALATVAIALAASGSGALGITSGPLVATPDSVSFHHVAQSTQQTITETLENQGTVTLNINSVGLSGPDQGDFSLSNNTCANSQSTLNVGDQCSVDITFSPSQNAGESASLDISDD
ncbi:MAG TPA: choice-of-anchor D domain-containing protein, partial [Gaiellales bacterium]